jgi:glycosyltransferase involved in cell wall biosynthesis
MKEMKRLLAFSHAGVLEVNRALFHAMAEVAEVEITLVVPRRWKGDLIQNLAFVSGPEDRRLRIVPLPAALPGNGSLFFYASPLKGLIRNWHPDHVFIDEEPWSLAALQASWLLPGIEKSFFTKQNIRKRLPAPFRAIERWIYGRSHHAYVVADEVGDVLRWKGYAKDVRYLPHSYDPALFRPRMPDERLATRAKLKIPLDRLVVAYFGRLTEEKGIADLLETVELSRREPVFERAHFLVVGNGPLAARVQAAPGVQHIPAIPHLEVGAALAACDLLVLPSRTTPAWKEQYGRILIEAMACGVPVAGSDSGEIPRLIARTGGGVVFEERDPDSMLAALRRLLIAPEKLRGLAQAGLGHVREHLTHEAVARMLCRDLGFRLRDAAQKNRDH